MEITGAIFDFDGTLFDSMHLWDGVIFKFFDRIGVTLNSEDVKLFEKLYLREALPLAIERFDLKESYEELFIEFFECLKELYLEGAYPKNDIIEFLEKLRSRGVKMGIATASYETAVEAVLKKFNMQDYFTVIYSTYTLNTAKTEPKVFDKVLEELGTDKDTTWIFEDSLYAAETAKANGYKLAGVYDVSEKNADRLKVISDVYIHNFSEYEI